MNIPKKATGLFLLPMMATLVLATPRMTWAAAPTTICTNLTLDGVALQQVATFPSARPRSLEGTAIRFGAGGVNHDFLFKLALSDLVPVATTNVGWLSVQLEIVPSSTYYPFFALADASSFAGIQINHASGGTVFRIEGAHDGKKMTSYDTSHYVALRSGTGQPPRFRADFLIFPGRSEWLELSGTRGPITGHFVPALHLNSQGPFFLVLSGGATSDTFLLRSVEIHYCSGLALADSELDFMGRPDGQGKSGWNYGYYDASADPRRVYDAIADFKLLENYSSTRNEWYLEGGSVAGSAGGWYTSVRSRDVLPAQGVPSPDEHWVIRRWTAPKSANYLVIGAMAKRAGSTAGDGVEGSVMVAGFPLFNRSIAAWDAPGTHFAFELGLSEGTPLDFVIAPNGTIDADWTDLTIAIGEIAQASLLPPRHVGIRRAFEVVLPTAAGKRYYLQTTDSLGESTDWLPSPGSVPADAWIVGDGLEQRRFYPADGILRALRSVEE